MNEQDFYWDWLKHENNTLSNRVNYFLVAHSMLLVAATADCQKWPFCLAGVITSIIWLLVNIKHVFRTHRLIVDKLRSVQHYWAASTENRGSGLWSNNVLLGIFLPATVLLLWAVVWLT